MKVPCPRCGREFKNASRVRNHLNQPISKCIVYYEELLKINTALLGQLDQLPPPPTPQVQHHPDVEDPTPGYGETMQTDFEPVDMDVDLGLETVAPAAVASTAAASHFDDPSSADYFKECHPNPSHTYGRGSTFMDRFDQDVHSDQRIFNLYYPFASKDEWETASFLLRSNLSMAATDTYLKLKLTQNQGLSFRTAKDLRNRAEMLPAGPAWKSMAISTVVPTKNKLHLFFRDPIECLECLMRNPLLQSFITFGPFRLFESAAKTMRVYTEWLSGEAPWSMQEKLPVGATLLGTVLSSDKTNISKLTGNRMAHPLLISLANIGMDTRNKSSNHLFLLLALLPIPLFIHHHKRIPGLLSARLFHSCLDIILAPLKKAAEIGVMMTDPLGWRRFCFPPLAAYIVDTPESCLIAGVATKTSSVTMASYKQLGDNFRHEPRTASTTIARLMATESIIHPWNLETYREEALKFHLNGVHRPFWRDYPLSDPSIFLTPEPLHHWHKMFWDHDIRWCIYALGRSGQEIDFRFSVLHPHTGFRHFKQGISKLKQVTGREHRDVQRYIVSVLSQGVPSNFLVAVRSLIDFRYFAQSKVINEVTCNQIAKALQDFHRCKQAILDAGARRGIKLPIPNWYIPKLEFLQSVVANIRENGVAIQWSADTTEHAHIEVVKDPAQSGNNQNYEPQICRYLDRLDKLRTFDLATAIREAKLDAGGSNNVLDPDVFVEELEEGSPNYLNTTSTTGLLANVDSVSPLMGAMRRIVDYFEIASQLRRGHNPDAPKPHRTIQCSSRSAFHLIRDPSYKRMLVDEAATLFCLPDLHAALGDYVRRVPQMDASSAILIGGRRLSDDTCPLPFQLLEVWNRLRIQTKTYHAPHDILDPSTVNAFPPSAEWPQGHYDSVVVNVDPTENWPRSGLKGHVVVDVRLVFRIVPSQSSATQTIPDQFLAYVQRFDIVPQINQAMSASRTARGAFPEPSSSLYILKRSKRSNGRVLGDVLPLQRVRALVDVVPRFGDVANRTLTAQNSTIYSSEYSLNKYFDKELFWALT